MTDEIRILANRYGDMTICSPKILDFRELVDFVEANTVYPLPEGSVWKAYHAHSTCLCVGPDGKFLHTGRKHYTLRQRAHPYN